MADERGKRAEYYERKAREARAAAETIKAWDAPDDVAGRLHVGISG
jgi:hypothetical protein